MELVFRPIKEWPGKLRSDGEREPSPFSAGWRSTLDVMGREVEHLSGAEALVVVELAVTEKDIRLDGGIRADRIPAHPGCIVSFESTWHGPLRYWTDLYTHVSYRRQQPGHGWRQNFRAIALGLEALRKVDRYGIADAGQQYTGWKELPSGIALRPAMTVEQAAAIVSVATEGHFPADEFLEDHPLFLKILGDAYKLGAKKLHPDVGGDAEAFRLLTEAKNLLEREVAG